MCPVNSGVQNYSKMYSSFHLLPPLTCPVKLAIAMTASPKAKDTCIERGNKMAKFLYPLIVLSNHQNYFSRNHVRLGDIEARLPIDRSTTSDEDQEHGTNLVGGHFTISKYD